MKKKIISLLLITTLILSLSSCLFINPEGLGAGTSNNGSDTTVNVQGGDTYQINISSNSNQNLIAASKALLSSVSIFTDKSAGSGVIYKYDKNSGDAYIITNYHVVYNESEQKISQQINAYLYGMEAEEYAIRAEYLGGSKNYDLAVLRVKASTVLMASNAVQVDVADSNYVTVLDTAIAIGNAHGDGISATVGCVNVDSENITVATDGKTAVNIRVMRTDAAVNSGNSGGGLFNDKGELIGIVNAKNANSNTDNIGFAIPSNVAKAVAENIIYNCDGQSKTMVYKYMLGITVSIGALSTKYDTESGKIHKIESVKIISLTNDSAVEGLLMENDIINSITVDGVTHEVTRTFHVIDTMLYVRADSNVVINVTRDGVARDVAIPIKQSMLTVNN